MPTFITVYAVSIVYRFFLMRDEPVSLLTQRAAEAMPRTGWLFRIADSIQGYLLSPLLLVLTLFYVPTLLFSKKKADTAYQDPCFHVLLEFILDKQTQRKFKAFRVALKKSGYDFIGTYKYKPDRLNQVCQYFVSRDKSQMAFVYSIYGDFQIAFATVFDDGSVALCTGCSDALMEHVEHTEMTTAKLWWNKVNSHEIESLHLHHLMMIDRWASKSERDVIAIENKCWKDVAVFVSRSAAHAHVELGYLESTEAPMPRLTNIAESSSAAT